MTDLRRAIFRTFLMTVCLWFGAAHAATREQVTSFFRAVQMDDAKTVQSMLGSTINPNEINPIGGEPALVLAVREGSMNVFKVLLAHPGTNIEAPAINGNTALMMAAFKHNKPALNALLAKGAVVDRPGWNALHYAAASGDDEIARILLQRGARIDSTSPAGTGLFTPLMMAAREGHQSTALLLLQQGANPNQKNSEGLTAAQLAERAGKAQVAAALQAPSTSR
ncbi:MAG: ankyrin repeat domain-containing protein [Massilia sp.]